MYSVGTVTVMVEPALIKRPQDLLPQMNHVRFPGPTTRRERQRLAT